MKTRLLILTSALLLAGVVIFIIGINTFFEIHATEERLASVNKAGSSAPTISYDSVWKYFETSGIFFGICGFLLIWRKRK